MNARERKKNAHARVNLVPPRAKSPRFQTPKPLIHFRHCPFQLSASCSLHPSGSPALIMTGCRVKMKTSPCFYPKCSFTNSLAKERASQLPAKRCEAMSKAGKDVVGSCRATNTQRPNHHRRLQETIMEATEHHGTARLAMISRIKISHGVVLLPTNVSSTYRPTHIPCKILWLNLKTILPHIPNDWNPTPVASSR